MKKRGIFLRVLFVTQTQPRTHFAMEVVFGTFEDDSCLGAQIRVWQAEQVRTGLACSPAFVPLPGYLNTHEDIVVSDQLFGNVARIIARSSPLSAGF
jgi:hypothetical protein